jgi:hypothetical protein
LPIDSNKWTHGRTTPRQQLLAFGAIHGSAAGSP